MTSELQAFAGHLLVVGGRAVSMPPPGAIAETAPKRAPRIRDGDSLFMLITAAEGTHAPAAFFEQWARLGADTYFASGGGITGGIREALTAINSGLIAHNQRHGESRRVAVLAAVQRGADLYIARCGRVFAALIQDENLVFFPADRDDPLSLSSNGLGAGPEPDIQLSHYSVALGQTLLLADAGLLAADDGALRAALSGDSVRAILDRLKSAAGPSASAMVVRFVAPGTPDPEQHAPMSSTQKLRVEALRPSRPTPAPAPVTTTGSLSTVAAETPSKAMVTGRLRPPIPNATADLESDLSATGSRARIALGHMSSAAASIAERTRAEGPSALQNLSVALKDLLRAVLRGILGGLLAVLNVLQRLLNQVLPAPDAQGRQGIPTTIAVTMTILIPVVIVVVVLALMLSKQGRTQFEIERDLAIEAHKEALALSGGSCEDPVLRTNWVEVLKLAEQAAEHRPNDETLRDIRADAQNYLDCYDGVTRRSLTLLHEFSPDAELVGPIVDKGLYIYTLDRHNDAIYYDTLDPKSSGDRLAVIGTDPIIYRGQAITGYVVGDLIDIEWLEDGATAHKNVLIALDRSGLLIAYSQSFFATAQQLVTTDWQNPVAMAVFGPNLYILDSGANQVWRYKAPPGESRYVNAPESYFAPEDQPDLSNAVDLGISDKGEVYILFRDGSIKKYLSGLAQDFVYSERPDGAITSGTALFVDNDPASSSLFIVDGANQTVYFTSWSGRFRGGYRPRNPLDAFERISGVYADEVTTNAIYIVAGNRLYHIRRS